MPLIPTSPIVEGRNVLTAAVYPRSRHWHLVTSLLPQWQTALRSAREALYAWSPPGWTPASLQVPSCVPQAGGGSIPSGAKACTCPLNTTSASQGHSRPKGLITLSALRDKQASSPTLLPALADPRVYLIHVLTHFLLI